MFIPICMVSYLQLTQTFTLKFLSEEVKERNIEHVDLGKNSSHLIKNFCCLINVIVKLHLRTLLYYMPIWCN